MSGAPQRAGSEPKTLSTERVLVTSTQEAGGERRDSRGGKDSHGFREVIDRTAGTLFLFSGGSRGQLPRGTFRFSRDKDKPPGI